MGIFDKRIEFKPYQYPDAIKFKEAIQHSYWLHSEWNFISDIQDFNVRLSNTERNAIKNTLLAISQIEVSVKKFWGKLGDRLPKSEFEQVGAVYAESEVRHADAYSHLLEILNLNDDFEQLLKVPAIKGRIDYLTKYLSPSKNDEQYALSLALFSIFVENISLFSQFAIIKSFDKHKNMLKDIDNVVQATMKEESVHALFGVYLINIIKEENPEWFGEEFYDKLRTACMKSWKAESEIIDWIFESGELEFLPKDVVKEYMKKRFNDSMEMLGAEPMFEINYELSSQLDWFDDEIYAEVNLDFFNKKSVAYNKFSKSYNAGDLF